MEFPEFQTSVYGLSYHSREIREPLYDRCGAGGRQKYEILLAHGGDEKHIPIDRKALAKSGFDYIALGHIHKPQVLEQDRIIYAGALEPVDQNDVGPHGFVQGEITDRGVRTKWVPFAEREYIHLKVRVDESDTAGSVRKKVGKLKDKYDNKNIFKIVLVGIRGADVSLDCGRMDDVGNILEIVDETRRKYDLERLARENSGNLIGRFIEEFDSAGSGDEAENSLEEQALSEGLEVLLDPLVHRVHRLTPSSAIPLNVLALHGGELHAVLPIAVLVHHRHEHRYAHQIACTPPTEVLRHHFLDVQMQTVLIQTRKVVLG